MKKRVLGFLIGFLIMVSLLAVAAFADESFTITYAAKRACISYYEGSALVDANYAYEQHVTGGAQVQLTAKFYPNIYAEGGDPAMFDCWNTEPDGSGTTYLERDTITVTENITLYAQWIANADVIDWANHTSAVEYVRAQLTARTPRIRFRVNNYEETINSANLKSLTDEAFQHTGNPCEGDYLRLNTSWKYACKSLGYNYFCYIDPTYYTTQEMEDKLDAKVAALIDSMNLEGKSEFEKFIAIYAWIIDNVAYDTDNLYTEPEYLPMYTAYAALFDGKAVCQGYAGLLYRMLLEEDVDCRVITGWGRNVNDPNGPGESHAWNIVKIGEVWYNVDATWDDGSESDQFTLRCPANFPGHWPEDKYKTDAFTNAHPMSENNYPLPLKPKFTSPQAVLSGQIGMYFFVEIPKGCAIDTVRFTVGERTIGNAEAGEYGGRTYYPCYLTSIEMADTITATMEYTDSFGGSGVASKKTSLVEYLGDLVDYYGAYVENVYGASSAEIAFAEKVVSIAKAIQNYGYFAQQAVPGGSRHTPVPETYIAEIDLAPRIEGFAIDAAIDREVVPSATFSLDLDTETALNFMLTTDEVLTEDSVTVSGNPEYSTNFEYTVEKVGQEYRVQVTGIGAHELGDPITVSFGNTTITASALSYAQMAFEESTAAKPETKNMAAALYAYCQAAMNFLS